MGKQTSSYIFRTLISIRQGSELILVLLSVRNPEEISRHREIIGNCRTDHRKSRKVADFRDDPNIRTFMPISLCTLPASFYYKGQLLKVQTVPLNS